MNTQTTKTKFSEVAKHYLGCKLQTTDGIGNFDEFSPKDLNQITCYTLTKAYHAAEEVKPLLYDLDSKGDMPNDVLLDMCKAVNEMNKNIEHAEKSGIANLAVRAWAKCVDSLRAMHIDCDGLIESGQAIDVTTLPINPYLTNEPKK